MIQFVVYGLHNFISFKKFILKLAFLEYLASNIHVFRGMGQDIIPKLRIKLSNMF